MPQAAGHHAPAQAAMRRRSSVSGRSPKAYIVWLVAARLQRSRASRYPSTISSCAQRAAGGREMRETTPRVCQRDLLVNIQAMSGPHGANGAHRVVFQCRERAKALTAADGGKYVPFIVASVSGRHKIRAPWADAHRMSHRAKVPSRRGKPTAPRVFRASVSLPRDWSQWNHEV